MRFVRIYLVAVLARMAEGTNRTALVANMVVVIVVRKATFAWLMALAPSLAGPTVRATYTRPSTSTMRTSFESGACAHKGYACRVPL